jgi:hypothetical protein
MATVETGFTEQIKTIQRQMARARLEIHQDVGGAVDGVQLLTDWRTIVRSHPWMSMAIAAALGYAVIPRRSIKQPSAGLAERAAGPELAALTLPTESTTSAGRGKWQLLSSAFALLAPIVVRVAQTYTLHYVESWLAEQINRQNPVEPERPRGKSDSHPLASARPLVPLRDSP